MSSLLEQRGQRRERVGERSAIPDRRVQRPARHSTAAGTSCSLDTARQPSNAGSCVPHVPPALICASNVGMMGLTLTHIHPSPNLSGLFFFTNFLPPLLPNVPPPALPLPTDPSTLPALPVPVRPPSLAARALTDLAPGLSRLSSFPSAEEGDPA